MHIQVDSEELERQYLCAFRPVIPPRQIKFTHKHWEFLRFGALALGGQRQAPARGSKSGLVCTHKSLTPFTEYNVIPQLCRPQVRNDSSGILNSEV